MENIRKKYKGIFERVVDALQQGGKEFDYPGIFVTQFWCSGYVFLSKTAWMRGKKIWPPPGFYVEHLRLELLCDRDEPAPHASIWLPAKKTGVDPGQARQAILKAAPQWLTEDEQSRCLKQPEDEDYLLCHDLPEGRDRLLQMLVEGDAQPFVDCMVSHMELLSRFTPVLDKLLVGGKSGGA